MKKAVTYHHGYNLWLIAVLVIALLLQGEISVSAVGGEWTATEAKIGPNSQPSVMVEQAAGQADPTNLGPVEFTATFGEEVTGFDASDVDFTGSSATGTLAATVSETGPVYTISVTGMTDSGTVMVSIPAGAAQNAGGEVNIASASVDNVVTYDVTAPDTTIDTHPPSQTHSAGADFTFSSTDGTATFECSLDGSAFASCASPTNFSGLAGGTHHFSVRAKDPAGNVDPTPATYDWLRFHHTYLASILKLVNPIPNLVSIDPATIDAGGAAFTMTVNGANFVSGSVVNWNGSPRTTTFVSSSQLTATISSGDISAGGSYPVTVFNPAPGGGTSNAINFMVNANPVPILTAMDPYTLYVGNPAIDLQVYGTDFVGNSVVYWNGSPRATTFINSHRLSAAIPAADLSVVGNYPITVYNPAPGGGTSNAMNVAVNPKNFTNYVRNGGFEAESLSWIQYSTNLWPLILNTNDLPVTPHGGSYAAWLGGGNDETAYLWQSYINMSGIRYLHFWYWIASEDSCGGDFARVKVNGSEKLLFVLCSQYNTYGWVHQVIDLNSYAGMNIGLEFEVTTNGMFNSNFFLDDVSITASSTSIVSDVNPMELEASPLLTQGLEHRQRTSPDVKNTP